jgi:hypothetical protein
VPEDYDPDYYERDSHNLGDVCDRLDKIEETLKESRGFSGVATLIVLVWLFTFASSPRWLMKLWYSFSYDVNYDQVTIEKKPTDCEFLHSPLGSKDCHYSREVSSIRVKIVNLEPPRGSINYVSFDDGRTWTVDDGSPPAKRQVLVYWKRNDD